MEVHTLASHWPYAWEWPRQRPVLFPLVLSLLNCFHSRSSDTWIRKELWQIPAVPPVPSTGELEHAVATRSSCNLLGHLWSTKRRLLISQMCWVKEPPFLSLKMESSKQSLALWEHERYKPSNCFNYLEENVINFPALQLLNLGTCVFPKG